jgi:prevent-host-death family protein
VTRITERATLADIHISAGSDHRWDTMTSISSAEARRHLSQIVNRVALDQERIIVTRRGKALVAIVPIEDVEWLEEIEDRFDIEAANAALEDAKTIGTISWEAMKAELGL